MATSTIKSSLNTSLATATVTIPTGTSAGVYNLGSLSDIFGISNFTQGRVVSLTFIVESGNTTYLGNVVSYMIYGNNVYVNLASAVASGTVTMQLKCQYI